MPAFFLAANFALVLKKSGDRGFSNPCHEHSYITFSAIVADSLIFLCDFIS
jgi:hypothetical protein